MAEYRLYGSKNQGERVDRVILEGSSTNPTRSIELRGEPVELSEEEITRLRASGLDLRKVSSSGDDDPDQPKKEEQQAEQVSSQSTRTTPPKS